MMEPVWTPSVSISERIGFHSRTEKRNSLVVVWTQPNPVMECRGSECLPVALQWKKKGDLASITTKVTQLDFCSLKVIYNFFFLIFSWHGVCSHPTILLYWYTVVCVTSLLGQGDASTLYHQRCLYCLQNVKSLAMGYNWMQCHDVPAAFWLIFLPIPLPEKIALYSCSSA